MSKLKSEKKYCDCGREVQQYQIDNRQIRCSQCHNIFVKNHYPCRSRYHRIRYQAKRRQIPFALSLRHWLFMNYFTLHWMHGGKSSSSFSIDRVDNSKGYLDSNVQITSIGYNSRKWKNADLFESSVEK